MKIILYDGSFKTTAFIRRLMLGLVKTGHQVYVLGFNEENPNPIAGVHYVGLGDSQNNVFFVFKSLCWGWRSGRLRQVIKAIFSSNKSYLKRHNLYAALTKIQPDVVHLQWVSNIKLFEAQLLQQKFRFVLSQRGYQTNVRPFVNAENFAYLQKWLPKFSGFHSVSKAIAKVGNQIYFAPKKINQVVYTGLDLARFEFQEKVKQNKVMQLISVGRPHWIKGYDLVVRALQIVKEEGISFHYQIIGAENDEELLFLIHDLGLTNEVELLPKLPQEQVFQKMRKSDVFLLSSIEEGIANVAVEAMALGTPVISTNCGGMQELITHKKEGWLVPVYDVQAMAKQLIEFSGLAQEQIQEIKLTARKKVELQHSEEKMVEGMLSLYNSIIE